MGATGKEWLSGLPAGVREKSASESWPWVVAEGDVDNQTVLAKADVSRVSEVEIAGQKWL